MVLCFVFVFLIFGQLAWIHLFLSAHPSVAVIQCALTSLDEQHKLRGTQLTGSRSRKNKPHFQVSILSVHVKCMSAVLLQKPECQRAFSDRALIKLLIDCWLTEGHMYFSTWDLIEYFLLKFLSHWWLALQWLALCEGLGLDLEDLGSPPSCIWVLPHLLKFFHLAKNI